VAFALAEGIGRGFDVFSNLVKSGDFDRLLLRPRSTVLQVAGMEIQMMRFGRLAQGAAVLIWSCAALKVFGSLWRLMLIGLGVAGGACLFYGLLVVQATLSFWTVETLEIMNTVTYGGVETGQYPITIYRPWFRRFFTFVIPLACVTYYPAGAALRKYTAAFPPTPFLLPFAGPAFLIIALQVWRLGERRYCSTGS
ncbi:MAG TPA: ABC-2 family transporter protein, partial [Chthonomonadales bacterium]|nr:ABC-2 family transporter protein [Chthonomonadales bacterium]